MQEKIAYTCFATDIIHEGHMNIIRHAKKYGKLVVGVLCDSEMVRYNRFPVNTQEDRVNLVKSIEEVDEVIIQNKIMYDEVFELLHPDYIVHGDLWDARGMKSIRENIVELTRNWGGELVEIPYTYNENVIKTDRRMLERLAMPDFRRGRLKRLLGIVPIVKTIEVHDGITGLIAEKTIVSDNEGIDQFDAMWISSLCDSTAKGKPDIELVDFTSRLRTINDVMEVTTKPIIFDGDTGGLTEHFVYIVRTLERMGVSAIIIEDKVGLKRNSLFGTEGEQTQDSVDNFCNKISAGKRAQLSDNFMIIARIESLILEKGMDDALCRARAYIDSGADGIMIHSRRKKADEILEFCDRFRDENKRSPIVAVPSSYNTVKENELKDHGVNIVIYANQLTRAAFPAMKNAAESILIHHRAAEIDKSLLPIKDVISLIDEL